MGESWFGRVTKSRVDIVSHSILVLFTRRERSWFSPLIKLELKATRMESASEGRLEFSLKIMQSQLFPGGAVVERPPANAGDMGSSSGPGGSHMPRSN